MRAMKIDANQKSIVKDLRAMGVSVAVNHDDILCGWKGRTFWFELKQSAKSSVRPGQRKLEAEWRGHYQIVWSLDQILKALEIQVPAPR